MYSVECVNADLVIGLTSRIRPLSRLDQLALHHVVWRVTLLQLFLPPQPLSVRQHEQPPRTFVRAVGRHRPNPKRRLEAHLHQGDCDVES